MAAHSKYSPLALAKRTPCTLEQLMEPESTESRAHVYRHGASLRHPSHCEAQTGRTSSTFFSCRSTASFSWAVWWAASTWVTSAVVSCRVTPSRASNSFSSRCSSIKMDCDHMDVRWWGREQELSVPTCLQINAHQTIGLCFGCATWPQVLHACPVPQCTTGSV